MSYASEYMKRRRVRLKAEGLCQDCADEPNPGTNLCQRCVVNRRQQTEGIRNLTKAEWKARHKKPVQRVYLEPESREYIDKMMSLVGIV